MAQHFGQPSMRPSRNERAPYIDAINDALADGRIDASEHAARVELAETCTSFADLDDLVSDIPFEYHNEELAKVKRAGRRNFLLSSGGVILVGALSWVGTRAWVTTQTAAEAGAQSPTSTSAEPAPETASGAAEVPTEFVSVVNWQKDTMPTVIDFLESQGIVWVSDVSAWDTYLIVRGATKEEKLREIQFRTDHRPKISDWDGSGEAMRGKKLRDLDMEKLLAEAKKATDLGNDEKAYYLSIRYWLDQWSIGIRGSETDNEVYWEIDGKKRWDPYQN